MKRVVFLVFVFVASTAQAAVPEAQVSPQFESLIVKVAREAKLHLAQNSRLSPQKQIPHVQMSGSVQKKNH